MDFEEDDPGYEALDVVKALREQVTVAIEAALAAEAQTRGMAFITSQLVLVLLVSMRDSGAEAWAVVCEGLTQVIAGLDIPRTPDGTPNVAEDLRRQVLALMA